MLLNIYIYIIILHIGWFYWYFTYMYVRVHSYMLKILYIVYSMHYSIYCKQDILPYPPSFVTPIVTPISTIIRYAYCYPHIVTLLLLPSYCYPPIVTLLLLPPIVTLLLLQPNSLHRSRLDCGHKRPSSSRLQPSQLVVYGGVCVSIEIVGVYIGIVGVYIGIVGVSIGIVGVSIGIVGVSIEIVVVQCV